MNSIFGPATNVVIILLMGLAIYGAFLLILRQKVLQTFSHYPPETRMLILSTSTKLIWIFRIMLWLTPIYIFVIPYLLFIYLDFELLQTTLLFALILANVIEHFIYRKWLINALTTMDDSHSEKLAA